ncbi:carboxypeptidase regulatory-like domain-containing protein [candidate division KSB1 bacterium]|nr:carboxypeptidase regulatory-like domain-containing protein [candidate division KSB1 bacterium]
MKLARYLVPAVLLIGIVWMFGVLSAGTAADPLYTKSWQDQQNSLAKQEMKELESILDRMNRGEELSFAEKMRLEELTARYPEEPLRDTRGLDNVGGPDAFGYQFVDNQGGDTATFEWIELSGDPLATWLAWTGSHDDNHQALNFAMDFPFYGASYSTCQIATNGTIQFTTAIHPYVNACLPTSLYAGPTIFPYWDDLHLDYGGQGNSGSNVIAWRNFGDYVVIEYDSIGHCCSPGTSVKFELLLFADGRMKFQYQNLVWLAATDSSMTIGIQATGTGPALHYVCNTTGIQPVNDLAIWFTLGESGSISGHVSDDGGQPLFQARVINPGIAGAQTFTDNQGDFSFPLVPVGTYSIYATKRGFESDTAFGVQVNANQNTTVDLTLVNLGLLNFPSFNVPVDIPLQGVVTSEIVIDQSINISDLDVVLDVAHTSVGDLIVTLTSPEGSVVTLVNRRGGVNDNFTNTAFDDEATTPIANGTAPYTGDFIPESPLSVLDGQDALGTWILTIDDRDATDSGQLLAWELFITPGSDLGGTIQGTVTSAENDQPIPNAEVTIDGTNLSRHTNAAGQYRFGFVTPGTYTVNFSAVFFEGESVPNVSVGDGDVITVNAEMQSGVILYDYTGDPVPITDNDTSYAPITVPDEFDLEYVVVRIVSLTHTFDGDLILWIENPAGERVQLSNRHGGTGENYIETIFTDQATTPIAQGVAPFTGTFLPEQPLSAFNAQPAMGNWTFIVYDAAGADQGAINSWQVIFGGSIGPRGDLEGTVTGLQSQLPVAGAVVTIVELDETETADENGFYSFHSIEAGTYSVSVHRDGFCDFAATGVVIEDEITTTLDIEMLNPAAAFSVTSISHQVVIGDVSSTTFTITNAGNCPLTWSLADTSAWMTENPAQGNLPASQAVEITVIFDAGNLSIGEHLSRITVTHSATGSPYQIPVSLDVSSSGDDPVVNLPTEFALLNNYPNPFNSSTELRVDVPQTALVSLMIYNLLGQEVAMLVNGSLNAGHHVVTWSGRDSRGLDVGTGLYIVQLRSEGHVFTNKVMLLR